MGVVRLPAALSSKVGGCLNEQSPNEGGAAGNVGFVEPPVGLYRQVEHGKEFASPVGGLLELKQARLRHLQPRCCCYPRSGSHMRPLADLVGPALEQASADVDLIELHDTKPREKETALAVLKASFLSLIIGM